MEQQSVLAYSLKEVLMPYLGFILLMSNLIYFFYAQFI
jgi:hypothetical protein